MAARAVMLQGTGSSVGKSLLVTGLARALTQRRLKVRPFKPQNMSNNAAVTADGGEIGRAQWLQALAARVPPSVHMNPVLLKPESETGSQIVVQGRIWDRAKARELQELKPQLLPAVLESFARLKGEAEIVLVEGAGSAAEINLRRNDIANMGFAAAADVPIVLVGDIDRGGVIAALVGTKAVLPPEDAARIEGFIVNRMRGDPSLFAEGMAAIVRHTGWQALGLVPFFEGARRLPAEDAFELAERQPMHRDGRVRVAVPLLGHIANFDDFDPLEAEPAVELLLIPPGRPLPPADLIVLPGSKATIADLAQLRAQGWEHDILAHHRRGGRVLGLCGGYQMLGRWISDPSGIEGPPDVITGLGLLDVTTTLTRDKRLEEVEGVSLPEETPFRGYEMHVGETTGPDRARPLLRLSTGEEEGAISGDGLVAGSYAHGLFADDRQRALWLSRLGAASSGADHHASVEATLDALAEHLERHLDIEALLRIAR
ncbi:MAG TPA: cobyric acid synthase [Kiloniellales bacterium]|nr:cobyric acid synthase [Kiloniellales bacterium]